VNTDDNQKADKQAKQLKQDVIDFLLSEEKFKNAEQLKHATFVVDTLPATNFSQDREKLLTLNRWQQMQSPTVVFPETSTKAFDSFVCSIDLIRPSARRANKKEIMSESVYQRREYGRKEKRNFYKNEIKKLSERTIDLQDLLFNVVKDFTELTDDEADGKIWGNLHAKMAVIYLDGNNFGKIQLGLNRKQLQLFDTTIKDYRRRFLHNLFQEVIKKKEDWITREEKLRLELLTWGGDEILLVVPAWQGWWTLNLFFETSKDWEFFDNSLTHAAGLVFCHHNAPIHRIKKLAEDLGNLAKKTSRTTNSVAYQVLESFDHTGLEIGEFRQKRLSSSDIKQNDLIIVGEQMSYYEKAILTVKEVLPKSRVHKIVNALLCEEKTKFIENAIDFIKDAKTQLEKQIEILLKEDTFWLHLIELWDYIPTEGKN